MKTSLLRSLLIVSAALIGLASGLALAGKGHTRLTGVAGTTEPTPAGPAALLAGRSATPADSPLTTKLQRDLALSSGVTRWLYWLEAIEKAQPADFLRLAMLAQGDPVAMRLVATRWAELYPRHFFDTLVAGARGPGRLPVQELANILFREWPKRDPEAAIAALNGGEDFGLRARWRNDTAETVIENDPERGLRLMADWHIDRFGPRMTAIAKWAAADPRHAAEFTLEHPAGYASELTMEAIGKAWAATDPAGALDFASARSGGLASNLAAAALKEWAGASFTNAGSWLANADARVRDALSPAFVESWAKHDASGALDWCQSNLSGSSLIQAVGGVLKGAADTDIAGAAALVTSLSPSSARAEAAVAVATKWFPEMSSGQPVKPEAIAWLSGLDQYSIKRVLDSFVQWNWASSDPSSLAAFLLTSNAEQVSTSAYSLAAREMSRKNPLGALDWANGLPGQQAITAGSDVFASWRSAQPEAAARWFDALPETDPRRQPFFESAVRTLAWGSPQAVEQFAAMSPTERATALGVIEKMTLPDDRRASLLATLKGR